jgi:hypothetical protein
MQQQTPSFLSPLEPRIEAGFLVFAELQNLLECLQYRRTEKENPMIVSYPSVIKIEGLSHPLIGSAYLKKDRKGNTLIIETKFQGRDDRSLDSLLVDLGDLVDGMKEESILLDRVDIRMNTAH